MLALLNIFFSLHTAFIACYKQPSSPPNSSHMASESTIMNSPIIGLYKDKKPKAVESFAYQNPNNTMIVQTVVIAAIVSQN